MHATAPSGRHRRRLSRLVLMLGLLGVAWSFFRQRPVACSLTFTLPRPTHAPAAEFIYWSDSQTKLHTRLRIDKAPAFSLDDRISLEPGAYCVELHLQESEQVRKYEGNVRIERKSLIDSDNALLRISVRPSRSPCS